MRNRFIVMEDDSDAPDQNVDAPGLAGPDGDPGAETEPGVGAPGPDDGSNASATGQDAPGGQDPLSVGGAGGLDATPPGDDLAAPPVDPETPIELEDTKGLNVDRLKKLTDREDLKSLKKEKVDASINSALNDVQTLTAAVEAFHNQVAEQQGISLESLQERLGVLNRVRRDQRYSYQAVINLRGGKAPALVMESFVSTIQSLFKAIIQAIIKVIEWIKEKFRNFFSENRWIQDSTLKVTDLVLTQRRTHASAFRLALKQGQIDEKAYVSLPTEKMWLTYQGLQPGAGMTVVDYDVQTGRETGKVEPTYPDAFQDLLDIAGLHQLFGSTDFVNWCNAMPATLEAIKTGQEYPTQAGAFSSWERKLKRARPLAHFEGYDCDPACRMYVSYGYLGSAGVIQEMPYVLDDQTVRDRLKRLAAWRFAFKPEAVEIPNGDLRYLYDEEIAATSKVSQAISDELGKQRRTVDIFTDQSTKLKNLLVSLETAVGVSLEKGGEGAQKALQYTEVSHAIHAVVRNASTVLDSAGMYCRKVQYSWMKYLFATWQKDSALVKTMHQQG